MKSTVLDGLFTWAVHQPDRHIDFNGFFWRRPAGNVLIDPMRLAAEGVEQIREHGGARWILLTNADHWRDSDALRAAFGAEVWAPDGERARLGAREIDGWYRGRGDLPPELRDDVDVHWLRGGKSATEAVLLLRPLAALLFGDVVRSHVSGELTLLPDAKLSDRAQVAADLRALGDLEPRAILLGDGDSLFTGAPAAFAELLDRLG